MIFLDTDFIFALVCRRDANHECVRAVMDEYRGRDLRRLVLTTNHLVEEAITLIRSSVHRDAGVAHDIAVDVGRQLFAGAFGRIHQATPGEERAAFEYLSRHRDKKYSLTDCLSFVVMDAHGISEALAVDEDFTHRFIAHPGPRPTSSGRLISRAAKAKKTLTLARSVREPALPSDSPTCGAAYRLCRCSYCCFWR